MFKIDLSYIGLTAELLRQAEQYDGLYLARVSAQHTGIYKVIAENGEIQAGITGKLRFSAGDNGGLYPVVGDWVLTDRTDDSGGNALIHNILERRSLLGRKAAGTTRRLQPIAANIDTILICMSLDNNYNLRRLERYLAVAWDSMATPVAVLTKADLCDDLSEKLAEVHAAAVGVDVVVTTGASAQGHEPLQQYLGQGRTVAFIGSSGVGKSTLINRIIGEDRLATRTVGASNKGRHTTTYRQLIVLSGGGVIIDTPGMRELQMDNADLDNSFADIDQLSAYCRFSDCTHRTEPGCAVLDAAKQGALSAGRLGNYLKLQQELEYQELNSRQREQAKINKMFGSLGAMKQAQGQARAKNRQR
jgi:ribosome biogenesis GTPase / thiamine phosphate phosphatase